MSTTTAAAPARSLEQRMTALRTANRIRSARAAAKRHLKHDLEWAALVALIQDVCPPVGRPEDFLTMKVYDVLLAAPGIGRVMVNKLLQRHRISPSKTLGGLSERQRTELAVALQRHADQRVAA